METPEEFKKLKAYYRYLMPNLTDEGWQICESVLTVRNLKKGEYLMKQGAVANHVAYINYGLMRMYYNFDGKEKVTEFFKEGDYTGDYRSFLLREPAETNIQALEDTQVIETSYDNLQMVYKLVPEANMIGRLVAEELFIDMCRKTTAQLSESLDNQYRILVAEKPWLVQRVPQYMIASYLGVTPEALSRVKGRTGKKTGTAELVY